jgi:hypothetical protein
VGTLALPLLSAARNVAAVDYPTCPTQGYAFALVTTNGLPNLSTLVGPI